MPIDRRDKLAAYRLIPTLSEYLLVEPDRMEAELHRLGSDGRWTCASFSSPDDLVVLESTMVTLRLSQLYEKVEFPA